ncbi:MAG TPA: ABC transporter permease [Nocardioidaceae bacterium]|nr:ABC transporter permease [Nocardioidaceae bacterium]
MSNTSVTTLVRSEFKKISSTRLWWGLLVGVVVFTAFQAGFTSAFAGVEPGAGQPASPGLDTDQAIRSAYGFAAFSGSYIFALILGITGMTGEYRYQTITPTFLVSPKRSRVVSAKMIAHLLMGVVYGVVALLAALVVSGIVIKIRGYDLGYDTDGLWTSMALAVLAVAIWTLLGIGIGTLIRNQIVAILVAIFVTFLIEPLLSFGLGAVDVLEGIVKFLPTNASSALMEPANTFVDYLDWWAGGLVLVGYAIVLAGLGILLSIRRDVS